MRRLAAVLLLFYTATAVAFEISLSLDSISHPAFVAERISMQPEAGGTLLTIGTLRAGGREFRDLRLKCREFAWAGGDLRCRGGALKVGAGETVPLNLHYVAARKTLNLALRDAPMASLAALLPELAGWQPKGAADISLHLAGARAEFSLTTKQLAFANAAGTQAGEGMALALSGTAQEIAGAWKWQTRATWLGGEVYWQPWYLKSGGHTLSASGVFDATQLRVDAAQLVLPGIGQLDGQLRWDRSRGALASASLNSNGWQAASAWTLLGQPLLGETPRVQPSGTLRFALAFDAAGASSVDLDLDLQGLDVGDGRFTLADLRAVVPWQRDAATVAQIGSRGGQVGALPLDAFALPLAMEGLRFGFDKFELAVLDGRLLFENFAARRENGQWRWQLAGALHPLSMPLLSAKLGLPRMDGLLSATIPRIHFEDSTLALDGALVISVFDGYLAVAGLKVVEPFGRAPRVMADIDARHLDLAMLTDTFSFGSITGYIDADVRGLEMVGWRPQAFAARVETSPGDFKKRISQRAVQNISSLGGAGAGAAIQRSFLRIFDTFGYDRIGLTCKLVGGVCEMGGLEETGQGYLMVKGGGLPALNVMGYNRRVSWDVLLSRLHEIAAGNSRPVIE